MLMSPTGAVQDQLETATTLTIGNLSISVNDETVSLNPEARITAAVDAEEAQLHFEMGADEKTLMPMSGAINADGVRFMLGTGSHVYTLSNETFMELCEITEEDMQMIAQYGDFFMSYANVLNVLKDTEKYEQFYALSWDMTEEMFGSEIVDTEIELDGETLPAREIKGEVTVGGLINLLDAAAKCGLPEVENLMDQTIRLVNAVNEEDETIETFADLFDVEDEETQDFVLMDMDCIYVTENPVYSKVDANMNVDDMVLTIESESTTRGEDTTAVMLMEVTGDDNVISYAISMDYTGPITAPTQMKLDYDILNTGEYSFETETDEGESAVYHSSTSTAFDITMDMETVDGLTEADMEFVINETGSHGYEDDLYNYDEGATIQVNYAERAEENGSVTGSCALEMNMQDETIKLSFDINRAQGEFVDYFAGIEELPLTANTEDACYNTLMADALGVAADAVALTAEDSVMELMTKLGLSNDWDEDYDEDVDSDSEIDEAEYDDGEKIVYSFEDAAEIYAGEIPAYTAPEGYELKEIEVSEYSLYAVFESEEDYFDISLYGYDTGAEYYVMKDGAFETVDGTVVEMCFYNDGTMDTLSNATVYTPAGSLNFYFGNQDEAAAMEIIAGLK